MSCNSISSPFPWLNFVASTLPTLAHGAFLFFLFSPNLAVATPILTSVLIVLWLIRMKSASIHYETGVSRIASLASVLLVPLHAATIICLLSFHPIIALPPLLLLPISHWILSEEIIRVRCAQIQLLLLRLAYVIGMLFLGTWGGMAVLLTTYGS